VTERTTQGPGHDAGVGELVGQLSEQVSRLVRDEMQLAQAELKTKGKAAGIGAGLFGGAGVVAAYGLGVLIAAAVLGLATVLDAWLAALIIGVVLLAVAGVVALMGKKQVAQASPPIPTEAISGAKRDVEALKGHVPSRSGGATAGERR
jgi:MFS family permease